MARIGFYFLLLLFLLLPGQGYYETLYIKKEKAPVVEITTEIKINDYPTNKNTLFLPNLTAKSVYVMDLDSGAILWQKNPDLFLPPASTTKIATALVALENYSLNKIFEVDEVATYGAQMGLKLGEKITTESLLYGLLLNSGNDAAYVLASKMQNGGYEQFLLSMKMLCEKLGIKNTQFTNVSGEYSPNHWSTSKDLARLAKYALLKYPFFAKIVATPEAVVTDVNKQRWYHLSNINKLLTMVPGALGVKTGFTDEAGECLVSYVNRDGRRIITVVLGSEDRFGESRQIIEWSYANFEYKKII